MLVSNTEQNISPILILCKLRTVGLERGPLSLVWIIEELLEREVAAPV
jgi:hypothetical protein